MRVLVCGGRDYDDAPYLCARLDDFHERVARITTLIHGEARGADRLAKAWAKARGINVQGFPADWTRDGKSAGPIRNQRMIVEGVPEAVIAFPGGAGTADMLRRARRAGLRVVEVPARSPYERPLTLPRSQQ